ncbi:hypothetical protein [Companilactobacillus furfuricola]|uniref:hypothetical protein n=1 Tax=Companilactobacillus furfuricola TaxID=1462575 RepID=UPI001FE43CE1|nr:hypothetical protein [Companilactobacillus furfuricola]
MKLPRTKREFALFVTIVSILSVNIIAPLITCFETGFSFHTWGQTLQVLPFIWLVVVLFVLITNSPASKVTDQILAKNDSFNARMIINCLINVLMMSVFLTVIGSWIGTRHISWSPIIQFFNKWPRNFAVSFLVEVALAQPFARFILFKKHQLQDKRVEAAVD